MPSHEPGDKKTSLADQNFGRSNDAWKGMNDKDRFKRAADTALDIFRSKAKLVMVLGLAGLGAWPVVKLTMKLNDQSAQGHPLPLSGDSFLSQLGRTERFSVSAADGSELRAKYVAVNGYATLVEERENGQDRFGEVRRRWYRFDPVSTNLSLEAIEPRPQIRSQAPSTGEGSSLTNAATQTNASNLILDTNFFPVARQTPEVSVSPGSNSITRASIIVNMNVDAVGDLVSSGEVDTPKGAHRFPVTFTLSKERGFYRIKQEVTPEGVTNSTHVFRAISAEWGNFPEPSMQETNQPLKGEGATKGNSRTM